MLQLPFWQADGERACDTVLGVAGCSALATAGFAKLILVTTAVDNSIETGLVAGNLMIAPAAPTEAAALALVFSALGAAGVGLQPAASTPHNNTASMSLIIFFLLK
jgi:hypothetical protein